MEYLDGQPYHRILKRVTQLGRNIAFLEGTVPPPDTDGPNAHTAKMTATFWIETVKRDDGTIFTQIQYSQVVLLDFDKLSWPHVSVATLTQGA